MHTVIGNHYRIQSSIMCQFAHYFYAECGHEATRELRVVVCKKGRSKHHRGREPTQKRRWEGWCPECTNKRRLEVKASKKRAARRPSTRIGSHQQTAQRLDQMVAKRRPLDVGLDATATPRQDSLEIESAAQTQHQASGGTIHQTTNPRSVEPKAIPAGTRVPAILQATGPIAANAEELVWFLEPRTFKNCGFQNLNPFRIAGLRPRKRKAQEIEEEEPVSPKSLQGTS